MNKNIIKDKSYAKVNLYFNIKKKRKDGYHSIESVIIPVNLFDELKFELIEKDEIILEICNKNIFGYSYNIRDNLIYKIAYYLKKKYSIDKGIRIFLKKNIPIGAGLGGGSSNASCTLKNLIKIWNINIKETINESALKFGMDIIYFNHLNMMHVKGKGEKLKKINSKIIFDCIIIYPNYKIYTYQAFKLVKINPKNKGRLNKKIIKSLKNNKKEEVLNNIYNDFENDIFIKFPNLKIIYDFIKKINGNCILTGSGSCLITFLEDNIDKNNIFKIVNYCRNNNLKYFICKNKEFDNDEY